MFDFTTATPSDLKKVYDAIAREINDDRFFTSRELNHLPRVLEPREQVLAFSSGMVDSNTWLVVATDKRILFLDKGMVFGLKQISIELDRINSVEGDTGLVFGTIKISDSSRSYEITYVWKKTVIPFTNKVRAAMRARQEGRQIESPIPDEIRVDAGPGGQTAAPSEGLGTFDQIERLERMRNAGTLTDEEFQAAKRTVLGL